MPAEAVHANGHAPPPVTLPLRRGDPVRLNVPENPRLHRRPATVEAVEARGAHVRCAAAATGRFRALWSELEPWPGRRAALAAGYCGEPCGTCGGVRTRRNGTCLVCDDCGSTTGCS
jgi:hypothetical protein